MWQNWRLLTLENEIGLWLVIEEISDCAGNFKSTYGFIFFRAGKDKNGVTRTAATGERTSGLKEYLSVEVEEV